MKDVTGIVVCSNTKSLIQRSYESVRIFYTDMRIIIIDGSDVGDPCYSYVSSLSSDITTVGVCGYNIGHGRGLVAAIGMVTTKYALIFDSDIELIASPIEGMVAMMEEDTFGVGHLEIVGSDGYEYNVSNRVLAETPTLYLHPYFQLIQVANYYKFPPYVHHGAPCFKTMNEIKRRGLSEKILKQFPGLGHTGGNGWNWKAVPAVWVRHDTAGTQMARRSRGLTEIGGGTWER
jgi:hypothetical protein